MIFAMPLNLSSNIAEDTYITNNVSDGDLDSVDRALEKFETYLSVFIIKYKISQENQFSLNLI